MKFWILIEWMDTERMDTEMKRNENDLEMD